MQLKTYKGVDLASALDQARSELGPDALVLATNEVRGRLGLKTVEITVAVDPRAQDDAEELRRLGQEVASLRRRLDPPLDPEARRRDPDTAKAAAAKATGETACDLAPALRTATSKLIHAGLSADLALRFSRSASETLARPGNTDRLDFAAERAMRELVSFAPLSGDERVTFVVGPPGAGKTTTAAKLAARLREENRGRVVLAEADLDGVGSLEQARHYAERFGIELVTLRDGAELTALVRDAGRSAAVVVDTEGVGRSDADRLARLAELRRAVARAEVALLIPSGLHRDEARGVLTRFAPLAPTCVGFTKVDDALCLGELVNALVPGRLPLAFVTNGRRVPRDIEDASPRGLTALLLRSGFHAERRSEAAP